MTNIPNNIEPMSLNRHLKNNRVDDLFYSHVSMIEPRGRFRFCRQNLDELYEHIHNEKHGVAEKPGKYSALYFDFDIKYLIENYKEHIYENGRFYDQDYLNDVINKINNILKPRIKNYRKEYLICCLLEKDIYKKNEKVVSGGFHLHYPNIFMETDIKLSLMKELKNVFGERFDHGLCHIPWLLYNGVKDRNFESYKLTKIFDIDLNEMTMIDTFQNYKIFDTNEDLIPINQENLLKLLPRIFSINPSNRDICEFKKQPEHEPETEIEPKLKKEFPKNIDLDRERLKKSLPYLKYYNNDYQIWIQVMGVCKSVFDDDEGYEIFDEWSQGAENYDDALNRIKWDTCNMNNYNFGVIVNIFKNLGVYESLKKQIYNDSSHPDDDETKPLKPADTHEDIAVYIISQFQKDKNVYYSAKKNRIHVYNENSKLFEEKPFEVIMNFVSFYMTPIIKKYGEYLFSQLNSCSKDNEKALQEKIKQKYKLLRDVKSAGYQKNVLTCVRNRINDDDEFIEKNFNKIKHLLAIADNKVINFKTLEIEERCKEHYFTYTTDNIFKADRPNREWVYNYVSQILKTENPEFVQCFLTYLGYCMTGETCIKKFPIWTGDGDNGKSACFNVIKKIFGKFAIVGNEKVFLKQKSNSVHSDEYLPLIGKRFSYLQEIDANSLFNEKLIKSITGGDGDISLRACGGTTVEVILDCKLLCICNGDDIPNFIDKQGFTNRLMVIPFKNKFERDTKKLIEIDSMKDDIFTELCFYVKEFFYDNNMDIKFSIEIESATNEVKDNKDSIKQFMDEKIEITTDEKDRIKKDSIFNSYSFYCKNSDFKDCAIGKVAFYRTLREKYKLEIHRDREFKCVKFIQDDDLLTIDNGLPPM